MPDITEVVSIMDTINILDTIKKDKLTDLACNM